MKLEALQKTTLVSTEVACYKHCKSLVQLTLIDRKFFLKIK